MQKILESHGSVKYALAQEISCPIPFEEQLYIHALMFPGDFMQKNFCLST